MSDWADEVIETARHDWMSNGAVGATPEDFYAQALRNERERCARIAERRNPETNGHYRWDHIAAAIRADSEGEK